MTKPIISIIIPTYNSEKVLRIALKSIKAQSCPQDFYEVIVADNESKDRTIEIAKKYGAKMISVKGKASQACRQVNIGAKKAKGRYIFILDHDIELSLNLIRNLVSLTKKKSDIDAWYLPYKIIAKGKLLTKVRNFEEKFYRNSLIAAPRIIKKEIFWKTENQYDPILNSGPADWDLTIQLKLMGAKTSYIKDYVYHHEENLSIWEYLSKKKVYAIGGNSYKNKWKLKNPKIYIEIVRKQYDPFYRLLGIFLEDGKWKRLIRNLHYFLYFLVLKAIMAAVYFFNLQKTKFLSPKNT